jgi:UDP-2,4-diacetamido-2,4,6-trideoxy-beta-L-altropyranose hydrolase
MVMKNLAIRVDAGTSLGMGHLMRCYSIAQLARANHRIHFFLMETDEPVRQFLDRHGLAYTFLPRTTNELADAEHFIQHLNASCTVLLDSYSLKTEWQKHIKRAGHRLIVIDDLHAWHHVADDIINHSGGLTEDAYSRETYTRLHLGYGFRMLRPSFMQGPAIRTDQPQFPGRVIISMGASDVPNNTLKIANACLTLSPLSSIQLLVSRLNPHFENITTWTKEHAARVTLFVDLDDRALYDLMAKSDTLICPASTIALEGCSVGMIVLVGITAENQVDNYWGLVNAGVAAALGDLNNAMEADLHQNLKEILAHPENNSAQMANQKDVFRPLQHELAQVFEDPYSLRTACENDVVLLFEWTNDPLVRANSFHSNPIAESEHIQWFNAKIADPNTCILIMQLNDTPVGVLRIAMQGSTAVINYSISQQYRGQSLGKKILALGEDYLRSHFQHIHRLEGYVKPSNTASIKSFVGYQQTEVDGAILFYKLL